MRNEEAERGRERGSEGEREDEESGRAARARKSAHGEQRAEDALPFFFEVFFLESLGLCLPSPFVLLLLPLVCT